MGFLVSLAVGRCDHVTGGLASIIISSSVTCQWDDGSDRVFRPVVVVVVAGKDVPSEQCVGFSGHSEHFSGKKNKTKQVIQTINMSTPLDPPPHPPALTSDLPGSSLSEYCTVSGLVYIKSLSWRGWGGGLWWGGGADLRETNDKYRFTQLAPG